MSFAMDFYRLSLERDRDIIEYGTLHAALFKRKSEEPDFDLDVYLTKWDSLETDLAKLDFLYEELKKHLLPIFTKDKKCDATAVLYRQKGNRFYSRGQHASALDLYTTSILTSATKQIMALAYANRSLALYQVTFYKESLIDITTALDCGYENLEKLRRVQNDCKTKLDYQVDKRYEDVPDILRHSTIESASNLVKIKSDEKWGRHVVATKNIEVGEVIAIEKPIACQLLQEQVMHCSECLELCYNTMPCDNCTQVLYCSTTCKETAFSTYHKYECPILLSINNITEVKDKICLPLKMILSASRPDEKFKSTRIEGISRLQCLRFGSKIDRFAKFAVVAGVTLLIKQHTDFFNSVECSEDKFKENLLELFFMCASNCAVITEYTQDRRTLYYESKPIARGLYSFYSVFNHSCDDNVAQNFHGTTLVLRATFPIEKGEQLFVNYECSYLCDSLKFRKDFLFKNYSFNCSCDACTSRRRPLSMVSENVAMSYRDTLIIQIIQILREGAKVRTAALKIEGCITYVYQTKQDKDSIQYALAKYALLLCYDILGNKKLSYVPLL